MKKFRIFLVLSLIAVTFPIRACDQSKTVSMPNSADTAAARAPQADCPLKQAADTAAFVPHEGFVLVRNLIPDVIEEIRYYTDYNFVGTRIDGYEAPVAILSVEAAQALKAVADELRPKGYRIKIYDTYRPQRAVDHFVRWSKDMKDQKMKSDFYPNISKAVLFKQGYIASKSGHSRGSTIDMTITDLQGNNVDMGGTFDYFGVQSHPSYRGKLTKQQLANRKLLRNAMMSNGFKPIDTEWWHFTLGNEPYPTTYFDFPVTDH